MKNFLGHHNATEDHLGSGKEHNPYHDNVVCQEGLVMLSWSGDYLESLCVFITNGSNLRSNLVTHHPLLARGRGEDVKYSDVQGSRFFNAISSCKDTRVETFVYCTSHDYDETLLGHLAVWDEVKIYNINMYHITLVSAHRSHFR